MESTIERRWSQDITDWLNVRGQRMVEWLKMEMFYDCQPEELSLKNIHEMMNNIQWLYLKEV